RVPHPRRGADLLQEADEMHHMRHGLNAVLAQNDVGSDRPLLPRAPTINASRWARHFVISLRAAIDWRLSLNCPRRPHGILSAEILVAARQLVHIATAKPF
ncbi:hypothetical protein, partial [Nocardia gipuzkoensis]